MKLFAKCEACRKKKWRIMKRKVMLPIGQEATSQIEMCDDCYKSIKALLKK